MDSSRIASPPSPRAGSGGSSQRKGGDVAGLGAAAAVAVDFRGVGAADQKLQVGCRDVVDEAGKHGVGQISIR